MIRSISGVSLTAPAGSSSADVQIPETSDTDHDHREEEMDISLPEEEPEPGKDAEMEEVTDDGDVGNSSKSSGKIREEHHDSDSQKPSSVKQKTRERLREGTTTNPSERLIPYAAFTPLACCTAYAQY